MRASYRSKLTSGVVALTATAVVAAPAITPAAYAAPEPTVVSVPARAASDPFTLLASPSNAVSQFVYDSWDWVLWGASAAVDAGNFVSDFAFPLYLVGEQAALWYGALSSPFLTPDLRDGLVEVLNNPLNFDAWGSGLTTAGNGLVNSIGNGVSAEVNYITTFQWLPFTLPPIPGLPITLAAAAPQPAAMDLTLAKAEGAGAIMDVFQSAQDLADGSEKIETNVDDDTDGAKFKLPVLNKLSAQVEKLNTDVKALFNRDGAESKLPTLRGLRTEVTEKLEKTTARVSTRIDAVTTKLTSVFSPKKADANSNQAKDSETKSYQPKTQVGKKLQTAAQSIAKKLTPKQRTNS